MVEFHRTEVGHLFDYREVKNTDIYALTVLRSVLGLHNEFSVPFHTSEHTTGAVQAENK